MRVVAISTALTPNLSREERERGFAQLNTTAL
jgi:hypothetical protein